MTDRERIYLACTDPSQAGLLYELERDCPESCVIDQAIGMAEFGGDVAGAILDALKAYPASRWQGDEACVVCDLLTSPDWWLQLITDCEDVPLPERAGA